MPCPFCQLPPARIVRERASAVLVWDAWPLSPGHALVIPRRHIGSWFDTTEPERADMLALLDEAKALVAQQHAPAGWTIGINDGPAAGQTVPHLHMHLIPRHPGDTPDPRGGVRWVLPQRAAYWDKP
jgi:diadenosine tetraphosphate (Ap4A) HIT family hydrolase